MNKNEGIVYQKLLDKRKKIKPKFQVNDLVRVADLKAKRLLRSDTTNWSKKLDKSTDIIIDTIPTYHIDNLPERYNEALLKKTELTLKERKML